MPVTDIVEVDNEFYILASSPFADYHHTILKHGDTFAVFDDFGDIKPVGQGEEGLYHQGTRFLSGLLLRLGRERPLLLSSAVKQDNTLIAVDLTNPDVVSGHHLLIPHGTLHLSRTKLLWDGVCYERLIIRNYGLQPVSASLALHFDADFADIFEVRGTSRERRGELRPPVVEDSTLLLSYEGLDEVVRITRISVTPAPAAIEANEVRLDVALKPNEETHYDLTIACETSASSRGALLLVDMALERTSATLSAYRAGFSHVSTSNEQFNDWVNQSVADLSMMLTETSAGPYPYAGVPWFSTAFGRDGLITALECLWLNPTWARGVLAYLADTQATDVLPERDAEPGKILHETRQGEMAALGEIPFGRYYGSHDATPLFVLLAAEYYRRTADRPFIEQIWPAVLRALEWMERFGDSDRDLFLEYQRTSAHGLIHQGWKDSHDAIFHRDGRLAKPPIALCEVQAYAYGAWRGASELAEMLGDTSRAAALAKQASALKEKFDATFWLEKLGTYALALDGHKRPCRLRTSNAGHCLLTGLVGAERARRLAETLLDDSMFSGWGIRTLATGQVRYNPMSYHNGSVWPHDNAIIAFGFARYGLKAEALRILAGLFDASLFVDAHRLPELFCGFPRRPAESPTFYPVACAPQSWAAGAVFLLLQAVLGLEISAPRRVVQFRDPKLPPFLEEIRITNLQVGDAEVDLRLQRHPDDVGVEVQRRAGDVEVVVVK
ncbi:MAG: amylo-alpha-1,6-glucosidase [Luteitalea sp.]|nr:amylo-alpha-1,6-glucosidase [Luteitalea sp.]